MAMSRDDRLVARARAGDDAAFEALYARHHPAVLAFCRHLTGNHEDAEDAVQHTFLAAYRQLAGADDEIELRPWLYTVARNRCLSLLRARRERLVAEPDAATHKFDGLTAEVERRQELRDLVRDLARLPEPQRAALVLSQLDALSYREIGAVLEVDAAKVKALVFQARSSLASAREARDTPCFDVRHEIATARGASLRRRLLRRHVGQCDGCREFEVAVRRQRSNLGSLLPVVPSAGLAGAVLGSDHGREGVAAAAGTGGAAAVAGGGGGMLTALGGAGLAKLAVVAAVVGGGAAGAVAAEVPQRVVGDGPSRTSADRGGDVGLDGNDGDGSAGSPSLESGGTPGDGRSRADGPGDRDLDSREGRVGAGNDADTPVSGAGVEPGDPATGTGEDEAGDEGPASGDGPNAGLPPGLANRDELPPGLAKRDELPPGLAKRDGSGAKSHGAPAGAPPGQNGNGGDGRGAGTPASPPGQSGGGGQNGNGGSPGGGNGNGGGNAGNGNANGQGNGAQGGAGGQQGGGNGQGNGNGKGNQPG
jgi:RNA polymerase sigma factor (sigma-70 family)